MQPTNAQIDAAVAILKLNPKPSSWEANARRLLEGLKLCRVQAETEPLGALKSDVERLEKIATGAVNRILQTLAVDSAAPATEQKGRAENSAASQPSREEGRTENSATSKAAKEEGRAENSAAPTAASGGIGGGSKYAPRSRPTPVVPEVPAPKKLPVQVWAGEEVDAVKLALARANVEKQRLHGVAVGVERKRAIAMEEQLRAAHHIPLEVSLEVRPNSNVAYATNTSYWLQTANMKRWELVEQVLRFPMETLNELDLEWSPAVQNFGFAYHEDDLKYNDQDGLANPKPATGSKRIGHHLCYLDSCTSRACPFGVNCRGSHSTLPLADMMKIGTTEKGRQWLKKYGECAKERRIEVKGPGVAIAPLKPDTAEEMEKLERWNARQFDARAASGKKFHPTERREQQPSRPTPAGPPPLIANDDAAYRAQGAAAAEEGKKMKPEERWTASTTYNRVPVETEKVKEEVKEEKPRKKWVQPTEEELLADDDL